jgi:hypothetical protein
MQQVKTGEPPGAKAPAARLCSSRVDWPAQPSLNLAQNYFSRISWIVSIVLYPITGLLYDSPCARNESLRTIHRCLTSPALRSITRK